MHQVMTVDRMPKLSNYTHSEGNPTESVQVKARPQPSEFVATILVMDDVQIVREHIVEMLGLPPSIQVLEADSTYTAVSLIERFAPQVAVLDIQVPGTKDIRNGIDVLKWIRTNHPDIQAVVITNYDFPQYRLAAKIYGAAYFFDKSAEFEQLPEAVRSLLRL